MWRLQARTVGCEWGGGGGFFLLENGPNLTGGRQYYCTVYCQHNIIWLKLNIPNLGGPPAPVGGGGGWGGSSEPPSVRGWLVVWVVLPVACVHPPIIYFLLFTTIEYDLFKLWVVGATVDLRALNLEVGVSNLSCAFRLCPWARHFTYVCLSRPRSINGYLVGCCGIEWYWLCVYIAARPGILHREQRKLHLCLFANYGSSDQG